VKWNRVWASCNGNPVKVKGAPVNAAVQMVRMNFRTGNRFGASVSFHAFSAGLTLSFGLVMIAWLKQSTTAATRRCCQVSAGLAKSQSTRLALLGFDLHKSAKP
jgi:hypothetical protein